LSTRQILLWAVLGAGAGLAAGAALSEYLGDVNRRRLRRAADRLQTPRARRLSAAAGARAAQAALEAQSTLRDLGLEALAVAKGVVELRGWVPTRAARTHAARIVGALPGIDHVVNSILVRGEDDRRSGERRGAGEAGAGMPGGDA
jgi:hypothetical protein